MLACTIWDVPQVLGRIGFKMLLDTPQRWRSAAYNGHYVRADSKAGVRRVLSRRARPNCARNLDCPIDHDFDYRASGYYVELITCRIGSGACLLLCRLACR